MRYRQVTLLAFAAVALLWLAAPRAGRSAAVEVTTAQRRARAAACARKPRVDYTAFSHRTAAHRKSCDACHKFPSENWKEVRAKDPFPDLTEYPEHSSCITCHREQFFARERPAPKICSNCHTGVTPRNTARHPFPNPAERFDASPRSAGHVSDFKVFFPHDKHLELFSEVRPAHREGARFVRASYRAAPQESDPKSCANCHQTYMPQGDSDDEYVTKPPKGLADEAFWLKKGTYKTSPRDHAT